MDSASPWKFPVPLGRTAHAQAKKFSKHQASERKAEQVYYNTLAVLAVEFFLKFMQIEVDLAGSDSWEPLMQSLSDIADLKIPNIGKLECRSVLSGTETVRVPLEVQSDRIGYVIVELDESLREGTLLGFVRTVSTLEEEIPIDQLETLDNLLDYLADLKQINQPELFQTRVNLSQWLQNSFEPEWQSLPTLLDINQRNLALEVRSNFQLSGINIQRGKVIDLGMDLGGQSINLLVCIVEQVEEEICVLVQVHPFGKEEYVPANLRLIVFSETEGVSKEVIARERDLYIQMNRFWCTPGDSFGIKIVWNSFSITENFVV